MVIPLSYVIDYSFIDSNKNISETWEMKFSDVYFNQELNVDLFKVS
jgi:hypothetical protein